MRNTLLNGHKLFWAVISFLQKWKSEQEELGKTKVPNDCKIPMKKVFQSTLHLEGASLTKVKLDGPALRKTVSTTAQPLFGAYSSAEDVSHRAALRIGARDAADL